ncbi:MAG: hypothetical protein WBG41_04260 [Acidimicrobiales bacterium]
MVRFRWFRVAAAAVTVVGTLTAIGLSEGSPPAVAATAAPACTFNGSTLPLITGASAGEKVAIDCTGLSPLHPYLVMEVSLLLGIDPKAAPLLDGDITSLSGLTALLSALPEINPAALAFPLSDLSGNLDESYTLPTTQAPDSNATCPPSKAEINMGLIGCGLAMIDLTTFKTVAAGSGLVEYAGDPLFPPDPKLALSTKKATAGQTVNVSDAPGATTYWWLSTLSTLESLLGGGSAAPPVVSVILEEKGGAYVTAPNTVTVTPAVYNYPVLTPPAISGAFTVPSGTTGHQKVTVTYEANLLGFPLANEASANLSVKS